MKTINGNILDIKKGIICHQVNCKGVAGAGLALQIRNKWPEWWHDYQAYSYELGNIRYVQISSGLFVVNLYAQNGYGHDKRHTNYAALGACLMALSIAEWPAGLFFHFPHGMGCGLGGGDWNIVSAIIEDALPDAIMVKW